MLNDYTYMCRFCGKQYTFKMEQSEVDIRAELWLSMMACNRCADYHQMANRYKNIIAALCDEWRRSMDTVKAEKIEEQMRAKLVRYTKLYSALTCTFFCHPDMWEPHMVQNMMVAPEKVWTQLGTYYKQIKYARRNNGNNPDLPARRP